MSNLLKTMNATIVTGTYTDRTGATKNSYLNVGKLFVYNNGGMSLKLDALPTGGQNINFYDIKPKQNNQQQNQQNNQQQNQQNNQQQNQ